MKNLYIFYGPPGSGKGTQAELLVKESYFATISAGSLIREEIKKQTKLGKSIEKIINNGDLIDDKIVFEMLKNHFSLIENDNIIIDGFPRNIEQVKILDNFIKSDKNFVLKNIFVFDVAEDEIINRIKNRLTCPNCGAVFNLLVKKPIKDNICDNCAGEIYSRDDDENINTIIHRNKVYNENVRDIVDFYERKNLTIKIDALKDIKDVNREIINYLREV
jgi:adenylate kinase